MELSQTQQRVIGCLLEKQTTTPEHYPLSLNSLTNACNQKSNRDPVMELAESQVQDTLTELIALKLVTLDEALSGRVNKYGQRFCNNDFGHLKVNDQQRAIICLLLLRGPQTPGELRTRSNRLAEFNSVNEVEAALSALAERELVIKLEREPGKRESRYMHLFGNIEDIPKSHMDAPVQSLGNNEIVQLQAEVAALKAEINAIKSHLGL